MLVTGALNMLVPRPGPEVGYDAAPPPTAPNFDEALRDMDDMFLPHAKDICVTTAGILDATGSVTTGTKGICITVVFRMSAKCDDFPWADLKPMQLEVPVLSNFAGPNDDVVTYHCSVRAAIAEPDGEVLQSSSHARVLTLDVALAGPGIQIVSTSSTDPIVVKLIIRQIQPGSIASNSMVEVQSWQDADATDMIGNPSNASCGRFKAMPGIHFGEERLALEVAR